MVSGACVLFRRAIEFCRFGGECGAQDLQVIARRWRIEVGTLVPGRCLSLGNSSYWETKGYLMKARPYVWLNPKGGMIARAGCPGLSMFPASFVVDRCTECRVGDFVCWVVASTATTTKKTTTTTSTILSE